MMYIFCDAGFICNIISFALISKPTILQIQLPEKIYKAIDMCHYPNFIHMPQIYHVIKHLGTEIT